VRWRLLAALPIAYGLICAMIRISYADFRITNESNDSSYPAVGVGPDRLARIAWADNRTGVYQIYWAAFDPAGSIVHGPLQITETAGDATWTRIRVDSQNRSFIIWRRSGHIHFARIGNNGTIEVAPKQISSGGSSCETPDLATTLDGVSHIVYKQIAGVIHNMQYIVLNEDGGVIRTKSPGNFDAYGVAKYPSIDLDPQGNAYMAWNDALNYYPGLFTAIYSSSGATISPPARIVTSNTISRSAIVIPQTGVDTLIFQESDRICEYLNSAHPREPLGALPGATRAPRIAGASGHPIYAVWQDHSSGVWKIVARGWDELGNLLPDQITISDANADATLPDIDTDGNGYYYVVWRDVRDGNGEIYMDAVRPTGIRVTAQVHTEHDTDPLITPSAPLSGVTVTLRIAGQEWQDITDDNGKTDFAADPGQGGEYEITLSGPYYAVEFHGINAQKYVPKKVLTFGPRQEPAHYEWPHGDSLSSGASVQGAYYVEKFRKEFWLERLGYAWNLYPTMRVGIYQRDDGELASKNGAGIFDSFDGVRFLRHRGEEADIVFHEYTHLVIADRLVNFGKDPLLMNVKNDQGHAMDEALPDYFAATFTNDPIICRCQNLDQAYDAHDCKPLRNIARNVKCPYPGYGYDAYQGSLILSGALWDLRGLIDGENAQAAPTTDALVFRALDEMVQGKEGHNPSYTFMDFYHAIKTVDQNDGGQHASHIDAAFNAHNISDNPSIINPLAWLNNVAFSMVSEAADAISLWWYSLPGASSYVIYGILFDWKDFDERGLPKLGDYILLAEGITDTTHTIERNPEANYLIAVLAVDSTGQKGYMSVPAAIECATDVDDIAARESAIRANTGRILFNSPNPFNPRTVIHIEMIKRDRVGITLYDVSGRRVRSFDEREYEPGRYDISWDGRNDLRRPVASGVYIAVLHGAGWRESKKILLLR